MRKVVKGLPFSFSRQHRLAEKKDFQSVFAKASKVACQRLLALYHSCQRVEARLGVVISKHHVRRAVDRNQLRRIIRESFRYHKERLKGLDIIVLIRSKEGPFQDKKQLRENVDKLWLRLIESSKHL